MKEILMLLTLLLFSTSQLPPEKEEIGNRQTEYFITTVQGKLTEDMPEFSFDVEACYSDKHSDYMVRSITVSSEGEILQTISIPELTLFGQTAIPSVSGYEETIGLELEDVNFDGYKDIRLFDTTNGNYRLEWIYLVWNPEIQQFEHDSRLNEISLASFDQEKQLIYGMERGGAGYHVYSTFQYLDGEPVKILKEVEEYLYIDVKIDLEDADICRDTIWKRNPATGEMELFQDEFIFFQEQENGRREEVMRTDAESDFGKEIREALDNR